MRINNEMGIGLRRLCDWCRLMWIFRGEVDLRLLEDRLSRMGLVSEWRAFGAISVEYLGMPADSMPLYDKRKKWSRKALRILNFIFYCGNFGHNIDSSYYWKHSYIVRKAISFRHRFSNFLKRVGIFPLDSVAFFFNGMVNSFKALARGK